MSVDRSRRHRSQAGFTLIELLVASALGLIIMTGLTSVVLTAYGASQTATNRGEAAGQIRNFEQTAYDDFATSSLPARPGGCGSGNLSPCTHDPIQLQGCKMTNSQTPSPQLRTVIYVWPAGSSQVDRRVGAASMPASTNVTAFSWYLDETSPQQSVVLSLTVTLGTISQSQTMRFYPRVSAALPPNVSSPC